MKLKLPNGFEGEISDQDYGFLQRIANSDFLSLIGGDQIRLWRWNNLVKIASKVRTKCETLGLSPSQVAPKFLSQFFESSSFEENETLQDMWSNLLLNKSSNSNVDIYYLEILKQLEPLDATVLNMVFAKNQNLNVGTDKNKLLNIFLINSININTQQLDRIIYKLYSFKVLKPWPIGTGGADGTITVGGPGNIARDTVDAFVWTDLGLDFIKKCIDVN